MTCFSCSARGAKPVYIYRIARAAFFEKCTRNNQSPCCRRVLGAILLPLRYNVFIWRSASLYLLSCLVPVLNGSPLTQQNSCCRRTRSNR